MNLPMQFRMLYIRKVVIDVFASMQRSTQSRSFEKRPKMTNKNKHVYNWTLVWTIFDEKQAPSRKSMSAIGCEGQKHNIHFKNVQYEEYVLDCPSRGLPVGKMSTRMPSLGIIFQVIFWTIFKKAPGTLPDRLRADSGTILDRFWFHFWSHFGTRIDEG